MIYFYLIVTYDEKIVKNDAKGDESIFFLGFSHCGLYFSPTITKVAIHCILIMLKRCTAVTSSAITESKVYFLRRISHNYKLM